MGALAPGYAPKFRSFQAGPQIKPLAVVLAQPSPLRIEVRETSTNLQVMLQPWGRVQGTLRVGPRVEPNQAVVLNQAFSQGGANCRS